MAAMALVLGVDGPAVRHRPRAIGRRPIIVEGWRRRGIVRRQRHYVGAVRVPQWLQRLYGRRWYGAESCYTASWVDVLRGRLR